MNITSRLKRRMSHLKLTNLLEECKSRAYSDRSLKELREYCGTHSSSRKNNEGFLPLHVAISSAPNPTVLRVLLDTGANVNTPDDLGFSSLHVAASEGEADAVVFLIQNGANPEALTNAGYTACHLSIVRLLSDKIHKNIETRKKYKDCFFVLLKATSNLDGKTEGNVIAHGCTLLQTAVDIHQPDIVGALLARGVEVPDFDLIFSRPHEPVMHRAVSQCGPSTFQEDALRVLELLLEHGGNPNERLVNPTRSLLDVARDPDTRLVLERYGAKPAENA